MPKYKLKNGLRFCSLACSAAIAEAIVGRLVGRRESFGHELRGECGNASPGARRQLRIRPLQRTPTRGAIAIHGGAVGGPRGISRAVRGTRRRAWPTRANGGAPRRRAGGCNLAQAPPAARRSRCAPSCTKALHRPLRRDREGGAVHVAGDEDNHSVTDAIATT